MYEILNLGAGVQSTTVLLMSEHGELPKLDCAIFADTGWEPQAVYDHLAWLEETCKTPIVRVSAGNIRDDHINAKKRNGTRSTIPFYVDTGKKRGGRTFRKCTLEYKIVPIQQFIRREILGLRPRQKAPADSIRQFFGISLDEIQRANMRREHWIVKWFPLIERRMTRSGCLHWLREHGYHEPPRSACVGCPFHSNTEWRLLKKHSPDDFNDAVKFDYKMRNFAALSGDAYLHRSLVPLDQVPLENDIDLGQRLLWQDECEGMCGV